jgi:hypothetical protein
VGAANVLRDTSCLVSRNENDSSSAIGKSTSRLQKIGSGFRGHGKVLNLCADSMRLTTVMFSIIAKNKFINR